MSGQFWDVVEPLMAGGLVTEGTLMGGRCVRAGGEFVAMPNHKGPGLVVKLPRSRVDELIEGGSGQPFAPAGKVFSEWVLISDYDERAWTDLITESVAFVAG